MVKKNSQMLDDPLHDIDWSYYWKRDLNSLPQHNKSKNWDNIAQKFKEWMEKDDYPERLLNKIKTHPEYTVLDIGCGEGVITIPLARKVSKIIGIDLSEKMLEILSEKADKEGLENLEYFNGDLMNINYEDIGKFDIVVASRCLNGIKDIENLLKNINKIGKCVYITLWGPNSKKYENDARDLLHKEHPRYPEYIYIYNMLFQMGITANVEKLKCETINTYKTLEEAVDRYSWKMGGLTPEETVILQNHLDKTLIKKDDGTLENPHEKPDWILIWWKNDLK